jgi:hypothetical protein
MVMGQKFIQYQREDAHEVEAIAGGRDLLPHLGRGLWTSQLVG